MQNEQVIVVGGGTMGTGIVYVSAYAGYDVTVVEPSAERAEVCRRELKQAAQQAVTRGKLDADGAETMLARIRYQSDIAAYDGPRPQVVIETVSERRDLKHRVLAQIEALEPELVGTNTSALSIDGLATVLSRPERFLGMHFFQPVWSFKFMEIVRGRGTSDTAVAAAKAYAERVGKQTVVVRDVPGFATSRLDLISSLEAIRMLEDGVASAEDIDRASVLAFHHPIGPLRLTDMVGLDVRLDIARVLEASYGERYRPPALLIEMVEKGLLGRKSGRGFFEWPEV